jgi:hypothetical protein
VHGLGLFTRAIAFDDDGILMVTNVRRVIWLDNESNDWCIIDEIDDDDHNDDHNDEEEDWRRRRPMTIMVRMKKMSSLMMKSIVAI